MVNLLTKLLVRTTSLRYEVENERWLLTENIPENI